MLRLLRLLRLLVVLLLRLLDRKRLLLVTQGSAVVLSATLAALAFAGAVNEWVVIGFALGLGANSSTGMNCAKLRTPSRNGECVSR